MEKYDVETCIEILLDHVETRDEAADILDKLEIAMWINELHCLLNAALNDLHGKCSVCQNYTLWHNQEKCRTCCYENTREPDAEVNDHWEWKGMMG